MQTIIESIMKKLTFTESIDEELCIDCIKNKLEKVSDSDA